MDKHNTYNWGIPYTYANTYNYAATAIHAGAIGAPAMAVVESSQLVEDYPTAIHPRFYSAISYVISYVSPLRYYMPLHN